MWEWEIWEDLMSKKHSVLVDLCLAHKTKGFSGIPQDARIMFSSLSHSPLLDVTGWIYGVNMGRAPKNLEQLVPQALLLGYILNGVETENLLLSRLGVVSKIYKKLKVLGSVCKRKYRNYPLHRGMGFEVIWRSFFQNTIPYSEFDILSQKKYAVTDLSLHRLNLGIIPVSVDLGQQDFVLFQDSRVAKFPRNTTSLIRYHDGIPVFSPDTVNVPRCTISHYKAIKRCEKKAIYICNSPSAQDDLSKISKVAAERSRVIPYVIPQLSCKKVKYFSFVDIIQSNVSSSTLGHCLKRDVIQKWLENGKTQNEIPEFIMTLSTLEPRKNHLSLIEAWQKLRHASNKGIKLLVVGSPGWRFESIVEAMKPHVAQGQLLHLEKVPQEGLPYLYSAAKCFVFPSFAEGFGLPPCEAMQCGCPVAVSDIKAHRYSCGEGALYFSPYDTDELMTILHKLTIAGQSESIRKRLIEKGLENVKRFKRETVLPQWEALFDELSLQKKRKKT